MTVLIDPFQNMHNHVGRFGCHQKEVADTVSVRFYEHGNEVLTDLRVTACSSPAEQAVELRRAA